MDEGDAGAVVDDALRSHSETESCFTVPLRATPESGRPSQTRLARSGSIGGQSSSHEQPAVKSTVRFATMGRSNTSSNGNTSVTFNIEE